MTQLRSLSLIIAALFGCSCAVRSQPTLAPGDTSLNTVYFKPHSVFEKLTWVDKDGKLMGEHTENMIISIDTPRHRLTYLLFRNDGIKDTTTVEWPSLRPISTHHTGPTDRQILEYRSPTSVSVHNEEAGKKASDTNYTLPPGCFDGYLSDYLLSSLPIKVGYQARLTTFQGSQTGEIIIRQVIPDVVIAADGRVQKVYTMALDWNGHNVLFTVNKSTGEVLKYVYEYPNGMLFIKQKI